MWVNSEGATAVSCTPSHDHLIFQNRDITVAFSLPRTARGPVYNVMVGMNAGIYFAWSGVFWTSFAWWSGVHAEAMVLVAY